MRITSSQLRQVIKEEVSKALREGDMFTGDEFGMDDLTDPDMIAQGIVTALGKRPAYKLYLAVIGRDAAAAARLIGLIEGFSDGQMGAEEMDEVLAAIADIATPSKDRVRLRESGMYRGPGFGFDKMSDPDWVANQIIKGIGVKAARSLYRDVMAGDHTADAELHDKIEDFSDGVIVSNEETMDAVLAAMKQHLDAVDARLAADRGRRR